MSPGLPERRLLVVVAQVLFVHGETAYLLYGARGTRGEVAR
jgi:hypothetical protein